MSSLTDFWSHAAGMEAAQIAARIPHAGSMCLLHSVHSADAAQLLARASSHRDASNPLARAGRLGAACGVEYAAQAMALHGALTAQAGSANGVAAPSPAGYLVNVRNLALQDLRELEFPSANQASYFTVRTATGEGFVNAGSGNWISYQPHGPARWLGEVAAQVMAMPGLKLGRQQHVQRLPFELAAPVA